MSTEWIAGYELRVDNRWAATSQSSMSNITTPGRAEQVLDVRQAGGKQSPGTTRWCEPQTKHTCEECCQRHSLHTAVQEGGYVDLVHQAVEQPL